MALFENQFNQVTVAGGGDVFTNWTYNGAVDTGPNYIRFTAYAFRVLEYSQ